MYCSSSISSCVKERPHHARKTLPSLSLHTTYYVHIPFEHTADTALWRAFTLNLSQTHATRPTQIKHITKRFPDDRGCEMTWSLAAIELVAWSVLQEDGSGEEVAEKALQEACRANPFVAWNLAHREIFDEVKQRKKGLGSVETGRGGGWRYARVRARAAGRGVYS